MLENVKIDLIWYLLIVGGSLLFLILFGLYLAGAYHFGKPLAPFLNTRVKRWSDNRAALFEIISLLGNVNLINAREETGGYRRLQTTRTIRIPHTHREKLLISILTLSCITLIFITLYYFEIGIIKSAGISLLGFIVPILAVLRQKTHTERVTQSCDATCYDENRAQPLIMPKSVYSVNSVPTILLLDIHPPLHPELKTGLETLINIGINNPDELKARIEAGHGEEPLTPGYTFESFYKLYKSTRQKYEFRITVSDITEALNKSYDKNYSESIMAKDFNAKTKAKNDNTTLKYGYAALIIVSIGVTIKLIYRTFYGGP